MNDRDLVVAFKGGDAHAYAVIYRQFRPVAESICLRILGNADDAAEAAQETMLRVFQGLPRFNGRYLLRAWVARIATNVCLDMIRKRSRRVGEVETPAAEDLEAHDHLLARQTAEDPGEVIERQDESRRVQRKLRELPEHHRDALLMREFDGLSHEEMAMKLGMTAPQVKALLHRAKKGFRRAWEVETGRASSFVFPAMLVAPFRWIRRMVSPAKDAVTEAAAPVIHLSAQPAVVGASAAVGERAAAAAGAILVAGTIGIGASVLPSRSAPAPKPARPAVIVAEPAPADSAGVDAESLVGSASPAPAGTVPAEEASQSRSPRPRPDASPSPSPSGSEEPAPAPTVTSQPSPSPAPSPVVPAYDMTFRTRTSTSEQCGCRADSRLVESRGTRTSTTRFSFAQTVEGAMLDAEGDAAYSIRVDYEGNVNGDVGTLIINFRVNMGSDVYTYQARLDLKSARDLANGRAYVFTGSYTLAAGPSGSPRPIASSGLAEATIKIWSDGSPYHASIAID